MSAAERLQPALAAAEPLFSARDLTRLYGPDKGCQGVSFDLYPGEVLGIAGLMGAGRTETRRPWTARPRSSSWTTAQAIRRSRHVCAP